MPLMNYYRDQSGDSVDSAAIRNLAWMIVTDGTNTAVYSTFTAIFAVVAIVEDIKYRQHQKNIPLLKRLNPCLPVRPEVSLLSCF